MNSGFTNEQEMLRATPRRFRAAECPTALVRRKMADEGDSRTLWRKFAELGWTALLLPEEHDGLGGSLVDLIVVLEETGRALLPGPFLATTIGRTAALVAGAPSWQELLPQRARGELQVSLAVAE